MGSCDSTNISTLHVVWGSSCKWKNNNRVAWSNCSEFFLYGIACIEWCFTSRNYRFSSPRGSSCKWTNWQGESALDQQFLFLKLTLITFKGAFHCKIKGFSVMRKAVTKETLGKYGVSIIKNVISFQPHVARTEQCFVPWNKKCLQTKGSSSNSKNRQGNSTIELRFWICF